VAFLAQFLKRFRNHPNIVGLLGFTCITEDPDSGISNLVFEYLENGSLLSQLKLPAGRDKLTGPIRLKIMYEVARTLHYLHSARLNGRVSFHRDVKSENICLAANFQPKLIDFGLATLSVGNGESVLDADLECLVSSQQQPRGTPGYCCPEYMGTTAEYKACHEVFSFGVVLLELISGTLQGRQGGISSISDITTHYRNGSLLLQNETDPVVSSAWSSSLQSNQRACDDCPNRPQSSAQGTVATQLWNLALACTNPESDRRSSTDEILRGLGLVLGASGDGQDFDRGSRKPARCALCWRKASVGASCETHFVCQVCVSVACIQDTAATAVPCPMPGCANVVVMNRTNGDAGGH
jgi:serine/threonine protein kinase